MHVMAKKWKVENRLYILNHYTALVILKGDRELIRRHTLSKVSKAFVSQGKIFILTVTCIGNIEILNTDNNSVCFFPPHTIIYFIFLKIISDGFRHLWRNTVFCECLWTPLEVPCMYKDFIISITPFYTIVVQQLVKKSYLHLQKNSFIHVIYLNSSLMLRSEQCTSWTQLPKLMNWKTLTTPPRSSGKHAYSNTEPIYCRWSALIWLLRHE